MCKNKQNNQEFNAINHKSSSSTIESNQLQFSKFESLIHLQNTGIQVPKKTSQQILYIIRTQKITKHNKTMVCFKIQKIKF